MIAPPSTKTVYPICKCFRSFGRFRYGGCNARRRFSLLQGSLDRRRGEGLGVWNCEWSWVIIMFY